MPWERRGDDMVVTCKWHGDDMMTRSERYGNEIVMTW